MKKIGQVLNKSQSPQEERNHAEYLSAGFINIEAVAKYLGIKISTLYTMGELKQIPHYRVGR